MWTTVITPTQDCDSKTARRSSCIQSRATTRVNEGQSTCLTGLAILSSTSTTHAAQSSLSLT